MLEGEAMRLVRFFLGSLSLLFAFYLLGHYLLELPFPTPLHLLQVALGVGVGMGLGLLYHRIWPLPPLGLAGWCGFSSFFPQPSCWALAL